MKNVQKLPNVKRKKIRKFLWKNWEKFLLTSRASHPGRRYQFVIAYAMATWHSKRAKKTDGNFISNFSDFTSILFFSFFHRFLWKMLTCEHQSLSLSDLPCAKNCQEPTQPTHCAQRAQPKSLRRSTICRLKITRATGCSSTDLAYPPQTSKWKHSVNQKQLCVSLCFRSTKDIWTCKKTADRSPWKRSPLGFTWPYSEKSWEI